MNNDEIIRFIFSSFGFFALGVAAGFLLCHEFALKKLFDNAWYLEKMRREVDENIHNYNEELKKKGIV